MGQIKGRGVIVSGLPTGNKATSLYSANSSIQPYKTDLGSGIIDVESGHKRKEDSVYPIFISPCINSLDIYKRVAEMSELKFIVWFGNAIGYSLTGLWGINWVMPILKIDGLDFSGWKSTVIFLLIVLFWVQKIGFAAAKSIQEFQSRKLTLKKKAHDVEKEIED